MFKLDNVPTLDFFKEYFSFVEDETLNINIAITFKHIVVLIEVLDKIDGEVDEETLISSSFRKDMILHTATIVESLLFYCLSTLVERGEIDKSLLIKKVEEKENVLYKIPNSEDRIVLLSPKTTRIKLKNNLQFIDLIRVCKKCKIISKDISIEIDELRKTRNKVHIYGMANGDENHFSKKDVDNFFEAANKIKGIVKEKLER